MIFARDLELVPVESQPWTYLWDKPHTIHCDAISCVVHQCFGYKLSTPHI